jgi:hypothetical protein
MTTYGTGGGGEGTHAAAEACPLYPFREFLCLALKLIRVVIGISKENGAVDLLWMKSRAVLHHLPLIELHDGSPPKLLIFACTHSMPLQT